jgi:hypothetical protein
MKILKLIVVLTFFLVQNICYTNSEEIKLPTIKYNWDLENSETTSALKILIQYAKEKKIKEPQIKNYLKEQILTHQPNFILFPGYINLMIENEIEKSSQESLKKLFEECKSIACREINQKAQEKHKEKRLKIISHIAIHNNNYFNFL